MSQYATQDFVDMNIPDKDKTPEWVLSIIKSRYKRFIGYPTSSYGVGGSVTAGTSNFYAGFFEFQRNREFSRALNTGDNQRKMHQLNDADSNNPLSAMKISWSPSMHQWKPMATVSRLIHGRETETVARAMDPTSVDRRTRRRYERLARINNAQDPILAEASAMMGVDMGIPKGEPQTEQELDIYESMGPKDSQTNSLTLAIAVMHNKQDYERRVKPMLANELRDTGWGVAITDVTGAGLPYTDVVQAECAVLPWCSTEADLRDLNEGGVIRFWTPQRVLETVGDAWGPKGSAEYEKKKKQLYDMAKNGGATDGRQYAIAGVTSTTFVNRRKGCVPVLTYYFKDINSYPISGRKGRNGDKVYEAGEARNAKWTTERYEYQVVYKGCWIVGTEDSAPGTDGGNSCLHWGCGLAYNMPRTAGEMYSTKIPLTVRAYNMTEMRNMPLAKLAMIKCIEIDALVIQLRKCISKIIPPGMIYNTKKILETIEDLQIPTVTKISHILEMYQQTGSMGYSDVDYETAGTPELSSRGLPITPNPGAMADFMKISQQIEWHINDFNVTIGTNDALMGTPVSDRTSPTNMKIQQQGGANALGFLFETFDDMQEAIALAEYGILQCTMEEGVRLEGMARMFGDPAWKHITFAKEDDPGQVGIEVVEQMKAETRQYIDDMIAGSISQGQIDALDAIIVKQARTLQQAVALISSRMEIKAKKAHDNQMALVQQQGQENQKAAEIGNQGLMAKTEAESKVLEAITQLKLQGDLQKIAAKGQVDAQMDSQRMMFEQQAQQQEILASMQELIVEMRAKLDISDGVNTAKIEAERMANDTARYVAEETTESNEEIAETQAEAAEKAAKARPQSKK